MRKPTLEEHVAALISVQEWSGSGRYGTHLDRVMRQNDVEAEAEHESTLKLVRKIRAEVGDQ